MGVCYSLLRALKFFSQQNYYLPNGASFENLEPSITA